MIMFMLSVMLMLVINIMCDDNVHVDVHVGDKHHDMTLYDMFMLMLVINIMYDILTASHHWWPTNISTANFIFI